MMTMKKFNRLLLCCLLITSLSQSADWVNLTNETEPFRVRVLDSDLNRSVLSYTINRYATDDVTIDSKKYTLLQKLRKESMIEEKGYPRLPRINRSLVIPDEGVMGFEIISSEYIEVSDIDIAPSKGRILRSTDPETVPYTFSEVYRKDAFFPGDLVNIRTPYILRDYRGAVVELNAFQYNPVTRVLRIYTDVTVAIRKIASGGENVLTRPASQRPTEPYFHKIYQRHFTNFDCLDYDPLFESGEMLIICYDDFVDEMEPFVEWKNQKGIFTSMVPVSEVGNDWRLIRDYIQDVYTSSNLTYVLLVGDALQLTTVPEDSGSDPVYALTSGDDSYPDIFIGRFSAETRAQLETQVSRTLDYEKYPQSGADWYHRGLGAASDQGYGYGHYGEADYQHIAIIADKLLGYTYTQVDSAYAPWGEAWMMSAALNEGTSILNYCGHGGPGGWGPPAYGNDDVNELVNSNMLPYVINVACGTGDFVEWTCMGETWLRATHNVTGQPTGGIGAYMSRTAMGWTPGMDMQDEAVDLLVAESMHTFGGLCFNGSMLMMDVGSGWGPAWEFKNLTIFGDPSLSVRGDTPFAPDVTHNWELPAGESSLDVVVVGPNDPVADAMVCGMNTEIYASGITNSSGQVTLAFDPPPNQAGEFTLTVSGGNTIPYITQIDVVTTSGPYVIYSDHVIQDDIVGNNNGQLDYAETVEISITVDNAGVEAADNVIGVLHCDDTRVSINQNTANFGNVPASSSVTLERAFEFEIDPQVNDGDPLVFLLIATDGINSWESNFSVVAHAPDVIFNQLVIDDQIGGNGNGCLDPGETADLLITLINAGSSHAGDVDALLSCADPNITVNSGTAFYGAISMGETAEAVFNVTAASTCPAVHEVEFDIAVSEILGYSNTTELITTISDLPFFPSGPDNYGYMAYDRFDVPLMPQYEWVELHPDSGGSGRLVPFVQLDQVIHESLPFPFQFYGVSYDSLTISNKGYVCMGITNEVYFENFAIPDTNGSGAMIAGYWYDLVPNWTNSGEVWQWFDDVNHRYIVEYNHVPRYWDPDSFETFEIILHDPFYHPTLTGDGQIKFQYKEMSGSTTFQGGQGTIGIENQDETDGIQYRWNAIYDVHAHLVENETAILISTFLTAPDLDITLPPVSPPIQLPAIGGSFEFDLTIENTGSYTAYYDLWLDVILPGGSSHPVLLKEGLTMGLWSSLNRTLNQEIPGSAPGGEYTYRGRVGSYPDIVFDLDSFTFEKREGDGSDSPYTDWKLTGWFEDDIETLALIPESYFLSQNYPNPFNPTTTISFALPEVAFVKLEVFDVAGRNVGAHCDAPLVDGWRDAGYHEVTWDASDLPSGVYIYRIQMGDYSAVKKMILIK